MIDSHDITSLVITVIGSGGLLGGIYALLKFRPEAGQLTVIAAQGALVVQTGVIETLRAEIARLRQELDELSKENDTLRARVRVLEDAQNIDK